MKEIYDTLKAENERLKADLEATQQALEESLGAGEELQARIKELEPLENQLTEAQGKLRGTMHRSHFDKEAAKLGIPEDLADDIWEGVQRGGYKTDSDDVKADAIREALVKHVESRPSIKGLLKKPAEGKAEGEKKSKLQVSDDTGRGGDISHPNKTVISRSKFKNDREYTRQHQQAYAKAAADGTLQLVD